MPVETVKNLDDVEKLRQRVCNAAACTRRKLADLPDDPMEALHLIKLEEFGHHYLFDGRLNLIEQLNQSFATMASLAAARRLLDRLPSCGGMQLRFAG